LIVIGQARCNDSSSVDLC